MSASGWTPQARAWSAWARPISPPSAVTAALLLMFCGLNGRTARPRRVNARHKPATSRDLPAFEQVPCSIRARAGTGRSDVERLGVDLDHVPVRVADVRLGVAGHRPRGHDDALRV